MKKLITSIIFIIIIIMMTTTIYAAGESKLSRGASFTYSSGLGLPPVVFTTNQDLLLCARAHTTLKYGNIYTRKPESVIKSVEEYIEKYKVKKTGTEEEKEEILTKEWNRTNYIISETRRTGVYILDGKKTDIVESITKEVITKLRKEEVIEEDIEKDIESIIKNLIINNEISEEDLEEDIEKVIEKVKEKGIDVKKVKEKFINKFLYSAGAQQVAFWRNEFAPKGDLKNGADESGASSRLKGYDDEASSLLSEAGVIGNYLKEDVIDKDGDGTKELNVEMGMETTPYVFPDIEKGEFKIGPISINYPRSRTVGNMNLSEIADIIIVDANGNPLEGEFTIEGMTKKLSNRGTYYYDVEDDLNTEENVNTEENKAKFYIHYKPKDGNLTVPSIQVQIKFLYLKGFADAEYAGYENSLASGQPLMNVYAIDEWAYHTFTVGTDINPKFDLSLKKSIIQVGDIAINDRVTVESTIGLRERLSYNAAYNKSTDIPLLNLKNLDDENNKIIYRIRIYNEGDIAGKATKVEDHLPDGLEYVGITKNPGYDVEYKNNIITLTATGDLKDIDAFDGNKMDYEDIEIECKFTDEFIDENIDEHKLTLTIDSDNDDLEKNEEVRYTITVTNEGTEEEKINTIMQTLPKKLKFIEVEEVKVENDVIDLSEFDEEDWVEVIKNSDKSKYIYYNLEDIEIGKLESGEKIEIVAKCKAISNIDEDEKIETSCKIVSTEAYEKDKSLYTTINNTVWYNNEEGIVTKETIEKIEYKLTQTIGEIKDKNNHSQTITDDHTAYNVKKGHVIEFKIKVTGENTTKSKVTVATYLPDGLEIIPKNSKEIEELEAETENKNLDSYNNDRWTVLNDNTVTREVNVGEEVKLYCVIKKAEGTFTTISEVVSEYENTATSTFDKSDLSKYISEKQESDDDYSIISTYSEETTNENNSDLSIEKIEIKDDDKYIITIKNSAAEKATIKKIYSNIKSGVIDTEETTIGEFTVAERSGKEIILKHETGKVLDPNTSITITIPYKRTNEEIDLVEEDGVKVEKNIVTVSAQIVEADGNEKTKSDWYVEATKTYDISDSTGDTEGYTSEEILNQALKNTAKITEVKDTNGGTKDRDETDWIDTERIMVTFDPDEEKIIIDDGDDPGGDPGDDPGGDPGDDPGGDPGDDPGDDSKDPIIKLTTTISGYVFEDSGNNKENEPNNVYDTDLDTLLEGIKVTLIEKDTGNIATLFQENEEKPEITVEQAKVRTNPTITDEKGYYSFEGVNPLKEYYINFEYNGVLYETVNAYEGKDPNTGEDLKYKINSKALETSGDREALNKKFEDISVKGVKVGEDKFVKTYSKEELVGKSAILYSYNEKNNLNIYELIAEYTRKYIQDNKANIMSNNGKIEKYILEIDGITYEYDNVYDAMKKTFEGDSELNEKLEFIKNTQIEASTKNTNPEVSYPLDTKYVIDTETGTIEQTQESNKVDLVESTEAKEAMDEMYDEVSKIMQEYVDADSQLVEDIYKTLVSEEKPDGTVDNKFYQQSRENSELTLEYDDYIMPLLDSTTAIEGDSYYPKTTYKEWDKDDNEITNNGYLYNLRNELAYLLNKNRLNDLQNYLDNTGYSILKEWSCTEAANESADPYDKSGIYAWSLEKLEGLYYEKVEKRTRRCIITEDSHTHTQWGDWTQYGNIEVVKGPVRNYTTDSGCPRTSVQYKHTFTRVCVQIDDTDTYTVYSDWDHSTSKDFRFYYWRGENSDSNEIIANNGISTCNVLPGNYRTRIENEVKTTVSKLNGLKTEDTFTQGTVIPEVTGIPSVYDKQFYVNLGLKEREEFDLTVAKDIYSATVSINGKDITYNYNNVDLSTDATDWIAEVRASDVNYERNIYSSDYMSVKNTDNPQDIDITVKYRIALKNQTANVVGKITELVDYYDKDYEFESIYVGDGRGNDLEQYISFKPISVYGETASIYGETGQTGGVDLQVGYITFENNDIHNNIDKFIYVTFKVTKTGGLINHDGEITAEGLKTDLIGNNKAKTNIVEINGYQTEFEDGYNGTYAFGGTKAGQVAGLMDKDSAPGNYRPDENYDGNIKRYKPVEDDEAVAGGLYLYVNYNGRRTIEGTVWEDNAIKELLEQKIRQGDGKLSEIEKLIKNVKVELVNNDGDIQNYYDVYLQKWIPTTCYTDADGNYKIENFIPGDYRVKFTYNNNSTNMNIGDNSSNTTYYNGQDYKSTIYARTDETDTLWYVNEEIDNRKSDAKDLWGDIFTKETRAYVNNYSKILTNDVAESLIPYDSSKYALEQTTMSAQTPLMNIKVEYNKDVIQSEINKSLGQENSDDTSIYLIENIDFGLVERPRAQLSVQNNVANVKLILADGTVLFDALPNAEGKFEGYTNLASIPRNLATAFVETKEEGTPIITKLKNSTHVSINQGRITMNMDEELMQGANLQVTYEIEVKNVGEKDYNTEDFYNYGIIDESTIVTTKVDQIIDYVENNMKFSNKLNNIDINTGWEAETLEKIVAWDEIEQKYVNYDKSQKYDRGDVEQSNDFTIVRKNVLDILFNQDTDNTNDAYNTIAVLTGEAIRKQGFTEVGITEKLVPDETAKSDFILTQLISPENENDDLTYKNVLELVKTTNDVGRRMYFSISGNHIPVERDEGNPNKVLKSSLSPEGREIDTDDAELITIIPPFGANMVQDTHYAIFAIALVAFFGAGVYLIKKKVLK